MLILILTLSFSTPALYTLMVQVRYWIHIADVSRFVPPGSSLDSTALQRMTTLYLPTGPMMMLPPELVTAMSLSSTAAHQPPAAADSTLNDDTDDNVGVEGSSMRDDDHTAPLLHSAIQTAKAKAAPYLSGEVAGRSRMALSLGVVLDEDGAIIQDQTKVIGRPRCVRLQSLVNSPHRIHY